MKIPSVILSWITGILVILISIGGFVMTYIQAHTLNSAASIIGLIVGILLTILNYLTQNAVNTIVATLTPDQVNKLRAKRLLQ